MKNILYMYLILLNFIKWLQELDPAMETVRAQLPTQQTNIVIIPATVVTKSEPKMRPLGEVVNYISTSASQRLYDLSKSTSFCVKHFTIQLVRVVMTTKAENGADRIAGFCKYGFYIKRLHNNLNIIEIESWNSSCNILHDNAYTSKHVLFNKHSLGGF